MFSACVGRDVLKGGRVCVSVLLRWHTAGPGRACVKGTECFRGGWWGLSQGCGKDFLHHMSLGTLGIFLPIANAMVFSRSYVHMWELDHEEGWAPKNWWFQIVVLKKSLENPLDSKKIKPVNSKGNQPWLFIRKTAAEAEAPILWPPDVKSQLAGKDPDTGKDWRQEEKGTTDDEMVGWHHRPNGHEFEQTLRYSYRQGNLAWCSPWDSRDGRDWATEQQQQKHLPDKWQSQDPIVPSTIAIFEVCGHLITVWILSLFCY